MKTLPTLELLGKMYYWIIMKCILDLVKLITVRNFNSFCFLADTIVGNGSQCQLLVTYTRAGWMIQSQDMVLLLSSSWTWAQSQNEHAFPQL